jgi:hypothetical protein
MKSLLLALYLFAIAACTTVDPTPVFHNGDGSYQIIEYSAPGHVVNRWDVRAYSETEFPRSVTFTDKSGKTITLSGSFQIDEFAR